jgi:hypothetical protein
VRAALALVVLVAAAPARAQTGQLVRFNGGGSAHTDCMLVTDVTGVTGTRAARCTDGDPACDADGRSDGTCTFRVRVCLDAASLPSCAPDVVVAAQASVPSVESALGAIPMPVATADTCTDFVSIAVARSGRRGKVVLRESASMASGHADRDRVPLVCVGAPSASFATIQRLVFARSCATASCHGAGQAGGLDLTPDAAYSSLVGVPATNPAAHAAGLLRVAPGDPAGSFLLDKLQGTLTPDEGVPMPRVGASLPASSIALIRRWIAAGAPADARF